MQEIHTVDKDQYQGNQEMSVKKNLQSVHKTAIDREMQTDKNTSRKQKLTFN